MVEQDWQPLRDLGFSDEMILEASHVVGIFNHLTRLADGLGLELDPQTEEAARSGVPLVRADAPHGARASDEKIAATAAVSVGRRHVEEG
jgi:hypothetical protein